MADLEPFGDYLVMPCGCLVTDDAEALEHAAGCGICAGQILAIYATQDEASDTVKEGRNPAMTDDEIIANARERGADDAAADRFYTEGQSVSRSQNPYDANEQRSQWDAWRDGYRWNR